MVWWTKKWQLKSKGQPFEKQTQDAVKYLTQQGWKVAINIQFFNVSRLLAGRTIKNAHRFSIVIITNLPQASSQSNLLFGNMCFIEEPIKPHCVYSIPKFKLDYLVVSPV